MTENPTPDDDARRVRICGVIIIAAAGVTLAFMLAHPAVHAHDPAGFLEEMTGMARAAAIVHGALIAVMWIALIGFLGLVDMLGWRSAVARAGLIAFALGAVAHTAAAIINGFVVPSLTVRYAGEGEAAFATLRSLLRLCFEANHAAASLGVVAMSSAIVLWSIALVRTAGAARFVGAFGLLAGGTLLLVMAGDWLDMDVRGFTIRIAIQSAWWIAAGALLAARGRI